MPANAEKGGDLKLPLPSRLWGGRFFPPPNLYTATASTIVPSKLLVIKSPDFYYLIHREPKMGVKVMANLARVVPSRLSQLKGLYEIG